MRLPPCSVERVVQRTVLDEALGLDAGGWAKLMVADRGNTARGEPSDIPVWACSDAKVGSSSLKAQLTGIAYGGVTK